MHILHINLAKGFRGGERQTSLLINGLAKLNPSLKQSLVVRYDSPLPDFIDNTSNINILKISKPYSLSLLNSQLKSKKKYSLIHAHDAKASHLAYLLSKNTLTPYLITRRINKTPKNNWFSKKVYKQAVCVVVLSSAIQNTIASITSREKIIVIPDMAASLPSSIKEIERIRNTYPGKILIGHVGALVNQDKGQEFLIDAAKKLQKSCPNLVFLLIGEGKDRDKLEAQAKLLNNIKFIGFTSNIGNYLRAFDIFVFPSLQEGLGSTLLDAMEAELPIIASNVGGIPDIIQHDKNGRLISPKNSQAISDSILSLLNNNSLARRLANKGKEDSRQYHPSVISQRYMSVYESIS